MANEIKMSEIVMLIDTSFLNFVITDLKKNFERMLQRSLQEINLADLMVYTALDAKITPEDNREIEVLFIYDELSKKLLYTHPSDLVKELDGVAFKDRLGEFSFYSFQPAEMVSRQELYLESLKVLADAKEVKKLIVISFNEEYEEAVNEILQKAQGKEIVQFRMNEPENPIDYTWEMLAFPIMQALGIKGEEV